VQAVLKRVGRETLAPRLVGGDVRLRGNVEDAHATDAQTERVRGGASVFGQHVGPLLCAGVFGRRAETDLDVQHTRLAVRVREVLQRDHARRCVVGNGAKVSGQKPLPLGQALRLFVEEAFALAHWLDDATGVVEVAEDRIGVARSLRLERNKMVLSFSSHLRRL
jgi:hypothetical protein